MSAIVPLFFAGIRNLPVQGRFCRNFYLTVLFFFLFFAEKSPWKRSRSTPIVFLGVAGLPAPRRLATAPIRHGSASLTPPAP
jgi:hypothetical protein